MSSTIEVGQLAGMTQKLKSTSVMHIIPTGEKSTITISYYYDIVILTRIGSDYWLSRRYETEENQHDRLFNDQTRHNIKRNGSYQWECCLRYCKKFIV